MEEEEEEGGEDAAKEKYPDVWNARSPSKIHARPSSRLPWKSFPMRRGEDLRGDARGEATLNILAQPPSSSLDCVVRKHRTLKTELSLKSEFHFSPRGRIVCRFFRYDNRFSWSVEGDSFLLRHGDKGKVGRWWQNEDAINDWLKWRVKFVTSGDWKFIAMSVEIGCQSFATILGFYHYIDITIRP